MKRILVTGGTGVLGREVVGRLVERGDEVRVLTRNPRALVPDPAQTVRGDLATGERLLEAVVVADVIVHLATNPWRAGRVDLEGTRGLVEAARAGSSPHVVYISIVGVDRIPWGYYRLKLATERMIAESGLPWTVLRTTQFHDLVFVAFFYTSRLPVALVPKAVSAQPVDARDVADALVELASAPALNGYAPDLGGPEVHSAMELMQMVLRALDRKRPIVSLPIPGQVGQGFRAGYHLVPGGNQGRRTFAAYLQERIHRDGARIVVEVPYRRIGSFRHRQ